MLHHTSLYCGGALRGKLQFVSSKTTECEPRSLRGEVGRVQLLCPLSASDCRHNAYDGGKGYRQLDVRLRRLLQGTIPV